MPHSPGDILQNKYQIICQKGKGGFGAVYEAMDLTLNERVAIKESFGNTPEEHEQFRLEAKLLFQMSHENLPRVHNCFFEPGGGMYLVEDFIEGDDLGTILKNSGGTLPESTVLFWINQVCNALQYIHSRNVIHRDIKPENIRINPQGKAVLVDFGIAKVGARQGTVGSARAYSPGFSPVEQYGQGQTDARSDIYALGATLYTLLTGEMPPESIHIGSIITLREPRSKNPSISPRTNRAILKALEINPLYRFQTVWEFKKALQSDAPPPPVNKFLVPIVLGLGMLVLLIFGGIFLAIPALQGFFRLGQAPTEIAAYSATIVTPSPTSTNFSTRTPDTIHPTAIPGPLPPFITDEKGAAMALIPSGEFQMGSNHGEADERPVHSVYLDSYYMDVYEVTNVLYRQCVLEGACPVPLDSVATTREEYYGNPEYDQYPALQVNWQMARQFCQWRNGSLPSEAQWEKAARGKLKESLYPWGDTTPTCDTGMQNGAHYATCFPPDTVTVGSFAANGYGIYDMAGNVFEWTNDWYSKDYYQDFASRSMVENPTGPQSGTYRTIRGGAFDGNMSSLGVANRLWDNPNDSGPLTIGFRCMRPVELTAGTPPEPRETTTTVGDGDVGWKLGKLAYVLKRPTSTSLEGLDLSLGTEPVTIFESPNRISAPSLSPDGAQVAFHLLRGDLSIVNFNPGATALWSSGCLAASWSPDGSQLICTPSQGNFIYFLSAANGTTINRISTQAYPYTPAWSPIGNEIVYSTKTESGTNIIRLDLGDRVGDVLSGKASENYAPAFSPDGQKIAFQSNLESSMSEIWIMSRDGSGKRRITYTPEGFWSRAPSWSPDGNWIAFVSNQNESSGADFGEVYLVSVATGDVMRLTFTNGNVYDWRVSWGY